MPFERVRTRGTAAALARAQGSCGNAPGSPSRPRRPPGRVSEMPSSQEAAETTQAANPPDRPLLDLSDGAVKRLIEDGEKRGYVTDKDLNAVLPSEMVGSEQIENVLVALNEMGITLVELEEPGEEEGEREGDSAPERPVSEASQGDEAVPAAVAGQSVTALGERTDDPIRLYLREMRSVPLLSREGEIAIAKRIESGRASITAGLCESPLTFQAILIWRNELDQGRVLLRDIIDIEATYFGSGRR